MKEEATKVFLDAGYNFYVNRNDCPVWFHKRKDSKFRFGVVYDDGTWELRDSKYKGRYPARAGYDLNTLKRLIME